MLTDKEGNTNPDVVTITSEGLMSMDMLKLGFTNESAKTALINFDRKVLNLMENVSTKLKYFQDKKIKNQS